MSALEKQNPRIKKADMNEEAGINPSSNVQ
jgi:hypothetical protein